MANLGKTMMSLSSLMMGGGPSTGGLPALPGNLGLPPSVQGGVGQGIQQGKNPAHEYDGSPETQKILDQQRAQAETFNKSFADLLNVNTQLSGEERQQFYDAYSNKFKVDTVGKYVAPLTNFSNTLSQAPAGGQKPAPQTQAAAAVPEAPATVGPVPVKQMSPMTTPPAGPSQQPAADPAAANAAAAVVGNTGSLGNTGALGVDKGGGRARRGRVATLLTGLGGAVEHFGG